MIIAVNVSFLGELSVGLVLISLGILGLFVISKVWSVSVTGGQAFRKRRKDMGKENSTYGSPMTLPEMVIAVESASRGYLLSQWDIARILREALLNRTVGRKNYPKVWIGTREGRGKIEEILGPYNKDLVTIFEPLENKPRKRRFFLFSRPSKKDADDYLQKLDRALKLVCDEETKRGNGG
jgi:hypothetical protein